MNRIFKALFLFVLVYGVTTSFCAERKAINIGVLAHKDYNKTRDEWEPTAKYLQERIDGYSFFIVPLRFDEFDKALRDKKIDFVVTNSAYYVDLESRFGITRIATLKNADLDGRAQTEFGGVIFTKSTNEQIKTLRDLRGASFAAVDKSSFGGWIMALRELKAVDIEENDLKTTFYGTHEAVVRAVLEGKAEAGTVRSDTLERMAREKKINLDDFRVINQKNYSNFRYLVSTRLYPEWPFAKTKHIADYLAEKVAVSLISMNEKCEAASSCNSLGWTIPLDYSEIHNCLRELEMGPYEYLKKVSLNYFFKKYWPYIVSTLLALALTFVVTAYIALLNKRLRETKKELISTNEKLEEKVAQKTEKLKAKNNELQAALEKESHLRGILRTVVNINQMLLSTNSPEKLLKDVALCLVSNPSLESAKISLAFDESLIVVASFGVGEESEVTHLEQKAFLDGKTIVVNRDSQNIPEHIKRVMGEHSLTAVCASPLKSRLSGRECAGVLTITTKREGGFSIEELKMIEELSGDIGFALNSFRQEKEIQKLQEENIKSHKEFIAALVNMIEQRDTYTAGHTQRVALYAELIAKEMELEEWQIEKLVEAAKLHDIGKVVTPDSILLKPGSLTKLEYELIKEHVTAGYNVLNNVDFYKDLAKIVIYHHEKYDGSGYPFGKSGDDIPIEGYILCVADAFDAMTTNRIYKPRKTKDESLAELEALSGKWYHPSVVDAAKRALGALEIGDDTNEPLTATTPLEEERLSYFFRDRLTKLYNEEYLTLMLNGRAKHPKPKKLQIISLSNFTKYNKQFGWESGNIFLTELGELLTKTIPQSAIFRVWGDKFIIADYKNEIDNRVINSLLNRGVEYKIITLDGEISSIKEIMAAI